jgi:hypothetical protein
MFAFGAPLLAILIFPFSGFLAALYLSLALRNKSRRVRQLP